MIRLKNSNILAILRVPNGKERDKIFFIELSVYNEFSKVNTKQNREGTTKSDNRKQNRRKNVKNSKENSKGKMKHIQKK